MPPKRKSFLSRILASFFKNSTRTQPSHDQPELELEGISNTRPKRVPSSYAPRTAQDPTSRMSSASRATTSFLSGANDFEMGDINFFGAGYVKEAAVDGLFELLDVILTPRIILTPYLTGWDMLLKNTAPNALHDSNARYDPPKCDEDTRTEVLAEIMGWMEDDESPRRLLLMTGAAGSGKSALQQTTAERCVQKNTLAATFFLSSIDPTRNNAKPVIPTIAYQLGLRNKNLKGRIKEAIEGDPLIFSRSLKSQITSLIVDPCRSLRKHNLRALPSAILIDGLDECSGEDRQAELLNALEEFVLCDALPFRIFIASRPELAVRKMLDLGGGPHEVVYHIQLSDKYDATEDIRRYLWRRLRDIGRRSDDTRARSHLWPTHEDIELLFAGGEA
ncbi:hypothetical protein MD484_g6721, partial [Candolleomyces efflorescens]